MESLQEKQETPTELHWQIYLVGIEHQQRRKYPLRRNWSKILYRQTILVSAVNLSVGADTK